jgi:SAM-dependent methyltransferase
MAKQACKLPDPASRRSARARLGAAAATPIRGYLSRQAARPAGATGRLLGRLWVHETAAVNDAALDLLNVSVGDRVLEIGFGPGRTLERLAEAGASVDGVEVSSAMLCAAAKRNTDAVRGGSIRLHTGDGIRLPALDDTIDAVLSVHTIYFWPDPPATIAEIARTLRPGGRMVLAFRDGAVPLPSRLDPRIYNAPTVETATGWLRDAGLTGVTAHRRPDICAPLVWLAAHAA